MRVGITAPAVADTTVFLYVNVLNCSYTADKELSFHELVLFIAPISSWRRKKKKKQVNSTGYKSSLKYNMILSPGGRGGSRNIEHLPTMDGTCVGERGNGTIPAIPELPSGLPR